MPVYAFELDTALTIDSFKLNGQTLPVVTTGAVRKVSLSTPLAQGAYFIARTFYHGQPPNGSGFFTRGLNNYSLPTGTKLTFTLSDMYLAQDWWPCKQDIRDKVDSSDIWLTVPTGTVGTSNGVLKAVTPVAGGNRYEWKHRFPAKYYLITAAVAPYTERSYTMQFQNGDTMRIQNFVYDTAGINVSTRRGLDSVGYCINLFSKMFGRYPFSTEKYGNSLVPLGGGMEHQTMTSLGYNVGLSTVMHELGHQWWGDCVSQRTWRDIWLSEGFATYCEQLFAEYTYGQAAAKAIRTPNFNAVVGGTTGTVYVNDTTDANKVFDYRLTYQKGAAVAHMLRFIAPSDSAYFLACRAYQQQYRYSNATTADLKAVFEGVYGQPLDTFFNQWIYGQGYPIYNVKWNYRGGTAYVQLTQTVSANASVSTFSTPLELQLKSAAGGTVIRIYNNSPVQFITVPMADSMTGVTVDPYDNILNRAGAASTYDATLGIADPGTKGMNLKAYPNPTQSGWTIEGLTAGTPLTLIDASGRTVWTETAGGTTASIPGRLLAAGTYLLTAGSGQVQSLQLVRQ
jgi:aminopeptidase N